MSYLSFREIPAPDRKTKVWEVRNKESNVFLGTIKWYGAWRCYAFYPEPGTIFENKCLGDIITFIVRETTNHKVACRQQKSRPELTNSQAVKSAVAEGRVREQLKGNQIGYTDPTKGNSSLTLPDSSPDDQQEVRT